MLIVIYPGLSSYLIKIHFVETSWVTSYRCVFISKVLIIYVVFVRIINSLKETPFRPM
jgi:hypothetical protein